MRFHRLAALALAIPAALSAQTLTPLTQYDFPADGNSGGNPQASVIQASDGYIYAADANNGPSGDSAGAVLKIDPTTGQSTVFYGCSSNAIDCNAPVALLQLPNGTLLVASALGGENGAGNLFTLELGTATYTSVYSFTGGSDGYQVNREIIYDPSSDSVFGTTLGTGSSGSAASAYGSIFKISGVVAGNATLAAVHDFSTTDPAGYQTTAGVTEVGGRIYGANQLQGASNYGAAFSFDSGLASSVTLETFPASGPTFPFAALRYNGVTGMLYGVTFNYGTAGNGGAVYSVSKTGAGPTLVVFNDGTTHNPNGQVAFDTAGNILFDTGKGGANGVGAQYAVKNTGGTPITLFSYSATDNYGSQPQAAPFIDSKGHVWTVQFNGTPNGLGSIDSWSLSTETAPPLTLAASAASVTAGSSVTLTYKGTNLYSDNEEKCFGANSGISTWDGKYISGTYSGGAYSGSLAVTLPTAKTYTFAIECGGSQTASVAVTATGSTLTSTTTTVTATPSVVAVGGTVTAAATVKKSSGSGVPTGSVTFSAAGTTLATANLNSSGVATIAGAANFPVGNYTITAAYNGDANDAKSSGTAGVSIRNASATTLTVNPTTLKAGGTTNVTIKVTSASGVPTGTASLLYGSTVLTTQNLSNGSVSFPASTAGYPAGNYAIHAVYNGSSTYVGSSSANVTVTLQ